MIATMSGDVRRSYGLFLGLAADEAAARGCVISCCSWA